jgi:NAD-dependent deacetylase
MSKINMSLETDIQKVKEMVSKAGKISALTGAGISVDSGIPDFRSEGGLWS